MILKRFIIGSLYTVLSLLLVFMATTQVLANEPLPDPEPIDQMSVTILNKAAISRGKAKKAVVRVEVGKPETLQGTLSAFLLSSGLDPVPLMITNNIPANAETAAILVLSIPIYPYNSIPIFSNYQAVGVVAENGAAMPGLLAGPVYDAWIGGGPALMFPIGFASY